MIDAGQYLETIGTLCGYAILTVVGVLAAVMVNLSMRHK